MLGSESKLSEADFFALKHRLKTEKNLGFRVGSGSMAPVIQEGELVLVGELDIPKRFDILIFFHKTRLICHLVKRVNMTPGPEGRRVFVTGGLKNLRKNDSPITLDRILGKVISHKVGWAMKLRILLARIWH